MAPLAPNSLKTSFYPPSYEIRNQKAHFLILGFKNHRFVPHVEKPVGNPGVTPNSIIIHFWPTPGREIEIIPTPIEKSPVLTVGVKGGGLGQNNFMTRKRHWNLKISILKRKKSTQKFFGSKKNPRGKEAIHDGCDDLSQIPKFGFLPKSDSLFFPIK